MLNVPVALEFMEGATLLVPSFSGLLSLLKLSPGSCELCCCCMLVSRIILFICLYTTLISRQVSQHHAHYRVRKRAASGSISPDPDAGDVTARRQQAKVGTRQVQVQPLRHHWLPASGI